jgi:hypothetical protein
MSRPDGEGRREAAKSIKKTKLRGRLSDCRLSAKLVPTFAG